MTDGLDFGGRSTPPPAPRPGSLRRRLRMVALILGILASAAVLINNGRGIWIWLTSGAPVVEGSQE